MLVLAAPHSALAGTASLGEVPADPKYGYTNTALFFTAAPGESNRITVTRTGPDGSPTLVLHDAGAPVTAFGSCAAIDEATVTCRAGSVVVNAGDGDDTVTLPTTGSFSSGYVRGGDGADVITGAGFLTGGAGNDVLACPGVCRGSVLAGGVGADVLRGSGGDDLLSGDADGPEHPIAFRTVLTESGGAGNDTIDGGGGLDRLTFGGRTTGVVVDLAAASATGAGGERDSLAGIEHVAGGDGDDLLQGDPGANVLEGNSGDDRISGRGGDDYLLGNLVPDTNEYSVTHTRPDAGADTLRGGDGDDTLDAGSEPGDVLSGGSGADILQDEVGLSSRARNVRCGSGEDKIQFALQGQLITSDCEQMIGGGLRIEIRPQLRPRSRLRFFWECATNEGCVVALKTRVRSSPSTRRVLTIQGDRPFQMRSRRPPRRGDVVSITMLAPSAGSGNFAARWRVRL